MTPAATPTSYLLANDRHEAAERFGALAACFDRATIEQLETIGVSRGWRCWEVGAGGPTVAGWMAQRVGATGQVIATDLDTTWLSPPPAGVDVRTHDVATDDPPDSGFDLVHARLVLCHVPGRERALRSMVDSLAPGGWLVIEDFDVAMGAAACHEARGEEQRRANRIRAGFVTLLAERGVDLRLGRTLPARFRALGLVDVTAEARFPVADPAIRALERANTIQVAAELVARGHATASEIDAHLATLDDLDIASPPLFAVRGRRPIDDVVDSDGTDHGTIAAHVAAAPAPRVVVERPDPGVLAGDRLDGFVGLSDRTCGATGISMQLVVVPPGAAAQPHFHPLHETAIYILSGQVEVRSGPRLDEIHVCGAGDFVFTPAGLVHAPRNLSASAPVYLIAARNDPAEREQTVRSD